jgi:hypothetical protein
LVLLKFLENTNTHLIFEFEGKKNIAITESTALSLSSQLVFPGLSILTLSFSLTFIETATEKDESLSE